MSTVVRIADDGLITKVSSSGGNPVPTNPEQCYPSRHLGFPRLASRPQGGIDVELTTTRQAFILFMYSEAPKEFEKLHRDVYPKLVDALTAIDSNLDYLHELEQWRRGQIIRPFRIEWEDMQRNHPWLEELQQSLLTWLDGRDLWNDWFIQFILDFLQERFAGNLINVPTLDECYHQIVSYHDGQYIDFGSSERIQSRHWDNLKIELPSPLSVRHASSYSFEQIKQAFLAEMETHIDTYEPAHQALQLRRRQEVGFSKRNLSHYRWLVRMIWHREDCYDIRENESERVTSIAPDIKVVDVEAIASGCKTAAAYLGIEPPIELLS